MSAYDAYEILRKDFPLSKVRTCLDFKTFFAFFLVPLDIGNSETYLFGTMIDAVDKKTGKTFKYDLSSDYDAYERAKPVEIEMFLDTKMSDL